MDDRARIIVAACVGATLGAAWGWLYLTESGAAVRVRVDPALDALVTVRKALDAVHAVESQT